MSFGERAPESDDRTRLEELPEKRSADGMRATFEQGHIEQRSGCDKRLRTNNLIAFRRKVAPPPGKLFCTGLQQVRTVNLLAIQTRFEKAFAVLGPCAVVTTNFCLKAWNFNALTVERGTNCLAGLRGEPVTRVRDELVACGIRHLSLGHDPAQCRRLSGQTLAQRDFADDAARRVLCQDATCAIRLGKRCTHCGYLER